MLPGLEAPTARAWRSAQVFPTSPRIYFPLGLALAVPVHATGAPPAPTPTADPTHTVDPTRTAGPYPSATASATASATVTATVTATISATASPTLDATPAPTATEAIHVLLPEESFEDFPFDPLTILTAVVDGDSIDLRVRYGGGCVEHDFRLLAGRAIMESEPPQADIRLSHDAHGDLCRALITRDLRFDLVPLKTYFQGDRATPGPLLLRLRGWDMLLRYDFP